MMNMQRLILEVKKREILWNRRNPRFKDKLKTDMEWENVAATVRIPTVLIKKKWRSLRDRFVKEFKLIPKNRLEECDDVLDAYTGKWRYFKSLIFLLPPNKKTGIGNEIDNEQEELYELEASHDQEEKCEQVEEFDLIEMDIVHVDDYIEEIQLDPGEDSIFSSETKAIEIENTHESPSYEDRQEQNTIKKRRIDLGSRQLDDLRVRNLNNSSVAHKEDEHLLFLRSLQPYMKKLNSLQQLRVRTGFQKVLMTALQNQDELN